MSENDIKRGIKSCLYSVGGRLKFIVSSGNEVYLQTGQTHRFYLDEKYEQLFGPATKNREATVERAKWAYLLSRLWNEARSTPAGQSYALWGDIGASGENPPVGHLGIGSQYKLGSFIEFTPEANVEWMGHSYTMEVFNNVPDGALRFSFMVIDKPMIRFSYFDKQKLGDGTDTLNDGLYHYGQTIILNMSTHLIPGKFSEEYEFEVEREMDDLEIKVLLTDMAGSIISAVEPLIEGSFSQYITDQNECNIVYEIPILINPKWKDAIHFENEYRKGYSVQINITNTKTGKTYESKPEYSTLNRISDDKRHVESFDVSTVFFVKYESTAEILWQIQREKTQQIQHIGDIPYTRKEYDPCGYSRIVLKDESDTAREPFTVFDEDKLEASGDKTQQSFDIIRGEEKKEVSITVEALQNRGVLCTGVMLPNGQHHNTPKYVFLMDRVLTPARTADGKQYATRADPTQKRDSDVYADVNKEPSKDVSNIQSLVEGVDYSFKGDNILNLKLNYWYNKTFAESLGSSISREVLNSAWTLNYFSLEMGHAQTYFVPISTCRYPNQIAKLRIFPDIEWELAALISVPKWRKATFKFESTRQDLKGFHKEYNFKYVKKDLSVEAELEKIVGTDIKLKASTAAEVFELGYYIEEPIKKVVAIFNRVYKGLEVFSASDEEVIKSAAYKKGVLNRFEFSIDPPNVAIVLKWNYAKATLENNLTTLGYRIEGGVALKPFIGIGITVDLVSIVGRFGLVGKAVELIIKALEYSIEGLDIFFNFKLEAEIEGKLSLGYHSVDGWDENLNRELTITIRASLEAGINYEGTELISTIVEDGVAYETKEELKINASLGAGIEYKENWSTDENGLFKEVTVTFLGAEAKLEIYSSITKRKKVVYNEDAIVSDNKGDIKHNDIHKILEKEIWYGPKKIYTDDKEVEK